MIQNYELHTGITKDWAVVTHNQYWIDLIITAWRLQGDGLLWFVCLAVFASLETTNCTLTILHIFVPYLPELGYTEFGDIQVQKVT